MSRASTNNSTLALNCFTGLYERIVLDISNPINSSLYGGNALIYYYYPSNDTFPYEVRYGGNSIPLQNYLGSSESIIGAPSGSVLLNDSGQYIVVKTTDHSGLTINTGPRSEASSLISSLNSSGNSEYTTVALIGTVCAIAAAALFLRRRRRRL